MNGAMKTAVVGAGIMGRLLAWRLCQAGYAVTIYDNNPLQSTSACSFAAAGMLSPFAEVESSGSGMVELGLAAMPLWQAIWQQLSGDYARGRAGSLLLGHAQDASELERFLGILYARSTNLSVKPGEVQLLDHEGLAELEPTLAGFSGRAICFPREGYVDPVGVMGALQENLLAKKVTWLANAAVTSLTPGRVRLASSQHTYDWVFDCRGLGAKESMPALRGVRGEAVLLQTADFSLARPLRLLHPRYRCYFVPRGNGRYVLGASEIESDDMRPVTVRSLLELLSALYSVFPELAEASVVSTMVHCRPALPDNMPRLQVQQGLMAINGLYRHGYLLAPVLADMALDLMAGLALVPAFQSLVVQMETL